MKLFVLVFCILFFVSFFRASAQETLDEARKMQIGATCSSFGDNDLIYFQSMEGAASYTGEKFLTLGINYLLSLNNRISLETGIEYSHHEIIVHPNVPPDMDNTPIEANLTLVNIPLTARINFLNYFFVNGGLMMGIDAGTSEHLTSQGGIGSLLGIGAAYTSSCRISVFVNPYLKAHSLLSFTENQPRPHLMESGIRFGITYCL